MIVKSKDPSSLEIGGMAVGFVGIGLLVLFKKEKKLDKVENAGEENETNKAEIEIK